MALTALDYVEIQQLVANYARAIEKTPQGWRFASRIHHVAMTPPKDAPK